MVMEGIWESSPAAPRLPSTTAFRASCLKSASDRKLLVGFSAVRGFFVPILVLFIVVFFVSSSSSSLGCRGGIVLPPMTVTRLQMLSGVRGVIFGSSVDVAFHGDVSARARARQ